MSYNLQTIGGLGTGALGDVTLSSPVQINSYANVTGISSDGKTLSIGSPSIGVYGGFVAGQGVIFHVSGCLGSETISRDKYGFGTILSVGTGQIVIDKAIPVIDLAKYVCQVVTVPNFNNLTVNAQISALAYDINKKYGGILIAKMKGRFDITNGMWLSEGKGIPTSNRTLKPAGIVHINADMKDYLVMNPGNGIAAVIANEYTDSAASRIGASWSGTLVAGKGGTNPPGEYPHWTWGEAASGVKGGRGGDLDGAYSQSTMTEQGYAGLLGSGCTAAAASAGATVMLLVNKFLNFHQEAISTGGQGGPTNTGITAEHLGGNGGAGFGGGGSATGSVCWGSSGGGAGYAYIATNTTTLTTNTIAYALDTTLQINKKALIQNKKSLDCSKLTSVDGFTFAGTQPSGTDRRVLFSLGAAKVAGSRTFPITTNAVAGDTVTIAGVTFTAIASGATGNQFNVGSTIAATAANLTTVLNSNATVSMIYSASSDSIGVITLTEKKAGYGNTPAAATKTGTIVFGTGTVTTSVPTWFKLAVASGVATMTAVATQDLTADSVLAEGNVITDLTGITSIPAFVGQQVYTAAALMAPFDATVMPTLSIALKGHNNQDQYQKDEFSAEYHLADSDVSIVSVTADTTTTGQASAAVSVALKQNGSWSGWMSMIDAKDKKASDIKYKATYTVTKLDGTDTAKVNKVSVIYCAGTSTVSGDTAEILTITQNYENSIGFAECLVEHKELMDAQIKSYVAFRAAPKKRMMINVGTGNGKTQTVKLGIKDSQGNVVPDSGINHDTLAVQFDGKPTFGYGYNTEVSELTFTADNDVAVTASYEHGWEPETWVEMTKTTTQPYNDTGHYGTKFEYEVPSGMDGKTISNMKTVLYRPSGTVTDGVIGTATGKKQLFVLPHFARKESIVCSGSWSYDDNSRILTVVADKGTDIKISYSWIAETQEIYGLTAGWAEE